MFCLPLYFQNIVWFTEDSIKPLSLCSIVSSHRRRSNIAPHFSFSPPCTGLLTTASQPLCRHSRPSSGLCVCTARRRSFTSCSPIRSSSCASCACTGHSVPRHSIASPHLWASVVNTLLRTRARPTLFPHTIHIRTTTSLLAAFFLIQNQQPERHIVWMWVPSHYALC